MALSGWSQTAASNTTLGGISTDGNITLVNQIDNLFRGLMAEVAVARDDGTIAAVAPEGHLHGLTLSNNAGDATNDIDIAVGKCATVDSPYWKMALASALTKRLDAAWAVGTGQGGLDTGSIGNATYHVWLIARSDTGVVDVLFSLSATSPTMPTNYDRKRRIGSIIRNAGAIMQFKQDGDTFTLVSRSLQAAATNPGTSQIIVNSTAIPDGIRVEVFGNFGITANGPTGTYLGIVCDPQFNETPGTDNSSVRVDVSGSVPMTGSSLFQIYSNTSHQFAYRISFSEADTSAFIVVFGWRDTRGRFA